MATSAYCPLQRGLGHRPCEAWHKSQSVAAALKDTLDIGFRKVVADEKQAAGMLLGDLIGETVTEVQAGRTAAFAPMLIRVRDTPRGGRRARATDDQDVRRTGG